MQLGPPNGEKGRSHLSLQ